MRDDQPPTPRITLAARYVRVVLTCWSCRHQCDADLQGLVDAGRGNGLAYGTGAGLGTEFNGAPLRPGAPPENTTNKSYFTGRSDNFAAGQDSGFLGNARL